MHYKPKRLHPFRLIAMVLRSLAGLLSVWPILALAAFFVSPIGPHMRWQYTYEQRGTHRQMIACEYLGSRGFVYYQRYGNCPFFTIIDRRVVR
ncbi:MAG: hypothetical protein KZQ96_21015 [Candidatus Thiodiazotropha sp. (ex Lucinoma borealis)]|nr:hypothetical protein [Candidatus Thiodiazotropha sp. (ex Lucinoma borealis)]